MIIRIEDNIAIEAIRHDETKCMYEHFVRECKWSESEFKDIEHFDFYTVEIRATNKKLKSNSAYLGACCAESFEDDVKANLGGYLPQMIDEAVKGLRAL